MKNKDLKQEKESHKRLIWGMVLIGYGIYSFASGIGFRDASELAMGTGMGQGSIFVIWGLKEWIEYSIKSIKKGKRK